MQLRWLTLGVMVAGLCTNGCGSSDGDSNDGSGGSAGIGGVGSGGDAAGGAVGAGGAGTGGAPTTGGALGSGGAAAGGAAGMGATGGAATGGAGTGGTSTGGAGGTAGAAGGGGAGGGPSQGSFAIKFDYRFDTMNTFTPERRAALEAAGKIWESLLADEFEDVPANTPIRCRDPKMPTGTGMVFTVEYPIDDLEVFVAFTPIDGVSTHLALSSNSFTNQIMDAALLAKLNARYNENPFQPWLGQASFDDAETWYFDATPATDDDIPTSSEDFISTALHEIGHLLGFGASPAFAALVVDGKFTGAHAVAANGGPVPMSTDLSHIDKTIMSDGRRNLMAPSGPSGVRTRPTTLDLAILQDLGYHLSKSK